MSIIYGSWTILEAKSLGKRFKAKCKSNYGYENALTEGKEYIVTITPRILPMSPVCSFTGDTGKTCECHLERFEKTEDGET
jgi:hypothetical protein